MRTQVCPCRASKGGTSRLDGIVDVCGISSVDTGDFLVVTGGELSSSDDPFSPWVGGIRSHWTDRGQGSPGLWLHKLVVNKEAYASPALALRPTGGQTNPPNG